MLTLAVLSQKGGSGKTTLTVNLAVEAERRGQSTAILDLDPQASSCTWSDNRGSSSLAVDSIQPARLGKSIEALRGACADLVFIDTPPQTEQASIQSILVADLILIPCRPGFLDLAAIRQTLSYVTMYGKPSLLIFNAVPSSTTMGKEAEEAAKGYNTTIAPFYLHHRVAYMYAMRDGLGVVESEPKGKAAEEIRKLYALIMNRMKNVSP